MMVFRSFLLFLVAPAFAAIPVRLVVPGLGASAPAACPLVLPSAAAGRSAALLAVPASAVPLAAAPTLQAAPAKILGEPERLLLPDASRIEALLRRVDSTRLAVPRVLSEDELEALMDGRRALSNTATDPNYQPSVSAQDYDASQRQKLRQVGFLFEDEGRLNFRSSLRDEQSKLRRAMVRVNDWVRSGQRLEWVGMARSMSRSLLAGTTYAKSGFSGRNRPYDYGEDRPFAKADLIGKRLHAFRLWFRENEHRIHPVVLAALAYQESVLIHPFVNANGRSLRLAMDYFLQSRGYLPPDLSGGSPAFGNGSRRSQDYVEELARGILRSHQLLRRPG